MDTLVVWSHSRLQAYKNCPLMYHYRYVEKTESLAQSIEGYMGKKVHEALEWFYKEMEKGKNPSYDDLLTNYFERWELDWTNEIIIVKKSMSPTFYKAMGRDCLTNYHKNNYPFIDEETIATELYTEVTTIGGNRLRGYIDRVAKWKSKYVIIDYKTGKRISSQQSLNTDWQGGIYTLMAMKHFKIEPEDIIIEWHYLKHGEERISERTMEDLIVLQNSIDSLIETIKKEENYRPSPSGLCPWCSYVNICSEQYNNFKRGF